MRIDEVDGALDPLQGVAHEKVISRLLRGRLGCPCGARVVPRSLVTPDTTDRSDVAIRFFEDHPADIGVSYVRLGGPTPDGSSAFIGFSTRSGNIFTLGNHEAVVQNGSSLIFRPGL